jgi:hypothetical protein
MVTLGEEWHARICKLVVEEHGGTTDRLGRPWSGHFQRVAARLVFRRPSVGRAAVEAALMHDALMAGGRGEQGLLSAGLLPESIALIALVTPPPHANYFRDLKNVSPEENAIYLDYIRRIIATTNADAIYLKLADVSDTIDSLAEVHIPQLGQQLHDRYIPSRDLLFHWTLSASRA